MNKFKINIVLSALLLLSGTTLLALRECFEGLQPESLWSYFDKISDIPRASYKEKAIGDYILDVAASFGLDAEKQEVGNVIVRKPATAGYENAPTVVLQSHIDMVTEKNNDVEHNFDTDALKIIREGDLIKACGTTLGADDGIGVAAMLAVMTDQTLVHGPLEFFFTVCEEVGFDGARAITPDLLKGRLYLNLDSEEDGEINIGCAGGCEVLGSLPVEFENVTTYVTYKVTIKGLKGGHSGVDIHKQHLNVAKYLGHLIKILVIDEASDIYLASFSGGDKRNAIAREGEAIFVVSQDEVPVFEDIMQKERDRLYADVKFEDYEPNAELIWEETDSAEAVLTLDCAEVLAGLLEKLPHGVEAWDPNIENLVQTSGNLAKVSIVPASEDNAAHAYIEMSQRSSIETERDAFAQRIVRIFEDHGATIDRGEKCYPGWTPCVDSPLLTLAKETYSNMFNKEVEIKAVHAGLECGEIISRVPDMSCISYGPTIKGAHSPDERLEIHTVEPFWNYTVALLNRLATENI